jgi:proteasome lid subunit RPN8/RPN11
MTPRPRPSSSPPPAAGLAVDGAVLRAMIAHAAETYPDECCGALLGRAAHVARALPLPNTTSEGPRRRFLVGPDDYRRAEAAARKAGVELLGFYHSHPDHPAEPSAVDLAQAWPAFVYVILSVRDGRTREVTAWRLREDRSRFDPVPVTVAARRTRAAP